MGAAGAALAGRVTIAASLGTWCVLSLGLCNEYSELTLQSNECSQPRKSGGGGGFGGDCYNCGEGGHMVSFLPTPAFIVSSLQKSADCSQPRKGGGGGGGGGGRTCYNCGEPGHIVG